MARIDIESNSLFRADELAGRRFAHLLSFVSRARIRTREGFIRAVLLVREGDCLDDEAVAASVRNLRALRFIARAEATVEAVPDSGYALHVRVWDQWSTLVGVEATIEGRAQLRGLSLSEINLLGRGRTLSLNGYEYRERREFGARFRSENVAGTRAVASIGGGITRTGRSASALLSQPFLSEASVRSFRASYSYEDRELAWFTGARDVTRVLLPVAERRVQLSGYRRVGVPGRLTLFGGEVSLLSRTRSGAARAVWHDDYGRASVAADSLTAALGAQAAPPSALRVGATLGARRIRFAEVRGLDLVHGVQDVALGTDVVVTLGRALASFGTGPLDSYGRIDGYAAWQHGALLACTRLRAEGRYLDGSADGVARSRWRDVAIEGNGQVALLIPGVVQQTLVVAATGQSSLHADQFLQLLVSGYGGVRGYTDGALPAGRRVVGSVEDRLNLPSIHPALDLGVTLFGDVGRGWAASVPFGMNTGWRGSVGAGIRVGFPAGSGSNGRIEIAWPTESGRLGAPVLRSYVAILSTRR